MFLLPMEQALRGEPELAAWALRVQLIAGAIAAAAGVVLGVALAAAGAA